MYQELGGVRSKSSRHEGEHVFERGVKIHTALDAACVLPSASVRLTTS